jgi:hypothetical protein
MWMLTWFLAIHASLHLSTDHVLVSIKDPTLHRVMMIRNGYYQRGIITMNGNFVPDFGNNQHHHTMHGVSLGTPTHLFTSMPQYEYRTGRLIPGTGVVRALKPNPSQVYDFEYYFVPEIGAKILQAGVDFDINHPDRPIYNMPFTYHRYFTSERKKENQKNPTVALDDPPPGQPPPGYKLLPYRECRFLRETPKTDPPFMRVMANIMEIGRLSDQGDFLPDFRIPAMPRTHLKPATIGLLHGGPSFVYNIPRDGKKTEAVYEYRAGRLIKGTLHDSGNFEPEKGSRIIRFKDYTLPYRPRIYNLPGVLVKEE